MSLFDEGPPEGTTPPKRRRKPPAAKNERIVTDRDLDTMLRESIPKVFEPGYEAYKLRLTGTPWEDIANALGLPSRHAAVQACSRYLADSAKSLTAEHQQEALNFQIGRYEEILRHWWEKATVGLDEKAASVVLRTMERLDRVLKITDGDISISRETVVISGDPESYVKQLQDVVERRNGGPP